MDILNEEVFAVIIALTVVGVAIGIAQVVRPEIVEPFNSLGLLNKDCKIGDYPRYVYPGQNLTLCVNIYNHRPYPALLQIRYKIGDNSTLPTLPPDVVPSSRPVIKVFEFLLNVKENLTKLIEVPIPVEDVVDKQEVALIFELWIYDIDRKEWVFTGIWNHRYVMVLKVPIP